MGRRRPRPRHTRRTGTGEEGAFARRKGVLQLEAPEDVNGVVKVGADRSLVTEDTFVDFEAAQQQRSWPARDCVENGLDLGVGACAGASAAGADLEEHAKLLALCGEEGPKLVSQRG